MNLLDGLSDKERAELRGSLEARIVDTPRTQVAALKARLLNAKARGPAVATLVDGLHTFAVAAATKVLISLASDPRHRTTAARVAISDEPRQRRHEDVTITRFVSPRRPSAVRLGL